MKRNNNKGFTLAELLIVVAIIAVMVAVAIPTFSSQIERSRQSTDLANLRSAYAAANLAVLTKDDYNSDSFLAGETATLKAWFDGSNFVKIGDENKTPTVKGQATQKAAVVNLSGLSNKINYKQSLWGVDDDGIPAQSEDDHIGTTDKGILVMFVYNDATGGFDFGEIGFILNSDYVQSIVKDTYTITKSAATSTATEPVQVTDVDLAAALIDGIEASGCTFDQSKAVPDDTAVTNITIGADGKLSCTVGAGTAADKTITITVPVSLKEPLLGKNLGNITATITTT